MILTIISYITYISGIYQRKYLFPTECTLEFSLIITMLPSLRRTPAAISNLRGRVQFPARFKGTLIGKWADYWKNLLIDYRQMLVDLRTDIQDEPRKAFIWTSSLVAMYLLHRNNPSELDFKDALKRVSNEVVLVTDDCRNPQSSEHLHYLETCYNQGVIHHFSLGILSVMYTSKLSSSCDLYKAQCKYLQPTMLNFPSRIVDVGFMGRWWNIFIKTNNYDVNF